jgi:hypothetical protein
MGRVFPQNALGIKSDSKNSRRNLTSLWPWLFHLRDIPRVRRKTINRTRGTTGHAKGAWPHLPGPKATRSGAMKLDSSAAEPLREFFDLLDRWDRVESVDGNPNQD